MSLPTTTENLVRRFADFPSAWSYEPSARWVRGFVGDTAVVDSREQILVWEPRHKVPEYGFRTNDVRTELLEPSATAEPEAGYYRPRRPVRQWFDLRLGDRVIRHAAWQWDLPELEGYLGVSWFPGVLDRWLEEDEVVFAHPRDPHSRVDALPSSRHVVVRHGGQVLAESTSPVVVYETGLPPRYYLPREDVRLDLLDPSDTWTECPYKGYATDYWSARHPEPVADIAWSYPETSIPAIAGRIAFYSERLDVTVDGERVTPPAA